MLSRKRFTFIKECGEILGHQSKTVVLDRTVKNVSQLSASAAKDGFIKIPTEVSEI